MRIVHKHQNASKMKPGLWYMGYYVQSPKAKHLVIKVK
jgi:hypothetical protein